MATITEILGTDSFSASRLVINANFLAINIEVGNFFANFGISVASGNIDVSAATGGSIKGKAAAFNTLTMPASGTPTITADSVTGNMSMVNLSATNSVTTATVTVTSGGSISNAGTLANTGTATFNGQAVFNGGEVVKIVNIGAGATYAVTPGDVTLITSAAGTLTLSNDAALPNGYKVTILSSAGGTTMAASSIQGVSSVAFAASGYTSSVELVWVSVLAKFIIVSSSNMTIS
jgi:hypothetical protein